jgi:O-antigen ligase/tetratricopeptide (TPR) repeat protein
MQAARAFASSRLRRSIVWLVALKCAALLLVIDPNSLSAFDLPKSMVSRSFTYVLIGLLAAAAMTYGVRIFGNKSLHVPVAALVLVTVASTAFSPQPAIALYGHYERLEGLTFVLDMAVMYLAVVVAYRDARDWGVAGAILGLASLLMLCYAVAQRIGIDPVHWVDPAIRPFATLGNADMLGEALSVGFGVALGLAVFGPWQALGTIRVVAGLMALAFVVVAGFVATRSSLVGFAAAVASVFVAAAYLRRQAIVTRILMASIVIASATALLVATPLAERARATVLERTDLAFRVSIYEVGLRAFVTRPLLGYGPDTFSVAYPAGRSAASNTVLLLEPQSSAHSWVIQTLVSTGMFGLVALLGAIVLTVRTLVVEMKSRAWLAAPLLSGFAGYWGAGLFGVQSVGVDWFPWVAFASAAIFQRPTTDMRELRRSRLGAVLVATSIAFGLSGFIALSAGEEAWQARLLTLRQSSLAIEHASRAVSLDPGRGEYWFWLGRAYEVTSDWHRAADAYAQAAGRQPYNSTYWISLGRARARDNLAGGGAGGIQTSAFDALEKAIEADPNDPEAHAALAEVALRSVDGDRALAAAARATQLYPPDGRYDRLVLTSSRIAMDMPVAARSLEQTLAVKDSALLHVALAEIALRTGDAVAARTHADRAGVLAPEDPDVRALLARLPGR